jgi:glycosyltransferase 2 family protein
LKTELQSFFALYLLGLALNMVAVAVVLAAMLFPQWMIVVWTWVEKQFIRLDIWKANPQRMDKVQTFTGNYRNAVDWLKQHPGKLIVVIAVTFLQRCSVFLLTYMVYLGLGQAGTSIQEVVLLQASVYIAVDMLPLPGAQGITELMYRSVFAPVFSKGSVVGMILAIPIGMILINLYEAGAFDTLVWCVREVVNDFNNFRKVGGEKK